MNYLFKRVARSLILFCIARGSIAQVPCQTEQEIAGNLAKMKMHWLTGKLHQLFYMPGRCAYQAITIFNTTILTCTIM